MVLSRSNLGACIRTGLLYPTLSSLCSRCVAVDFDGAMMSVALAAVLGYEAALGQLLRLAILQVFSTFFSCVLSAQSTTHFGNSSL